MKKINGFTSLLSILIFSSCCFANNRPQAVTLTLGEGYYAFASKRQLENTGLPNLQLAFNLNERWAIEGGVGVINTDSTVIVPKGVHGFLYTLDGLYRFTPYKMVEPYVDAGVGAIGLKPSGNDSTYQGNVNAGLGAQVFFDRSVALRGEIKDIYTMIGGKNDVLVNLGVSFLMN